MWGARDLCPSSTTDLVGACLTFPPTIIVIHIFSEQESFGDIVVTIKTWPRANDPALQSLLAAALSVDLPAIVARASAATTAATATATAKLTNTATKQDVIAAVAPTPWPLTTLPLPLGGQDGGHRDPAGIDVVAAVPANDLAPLELSYRSRTGYAFCK